MTNIVQNNSKGYGYNYASLADLALHLEKNGKKIPQMRTAVEYTPDGRRFEFIEYLDEKQNAWTRGATIIIPDGKGMNAAQLYASGVTYARRVTLQLAESLATTDDLLVEDIDDKGERNTAQTAEKAPKRTKKQDVITPEYEQQKAEVEEMRKAVFAQTEEKATDEQKRLIKERYTSAEIMKMLGRMNKTIDQLTLSEAKTMLEARPGK